MTELKRSEMWWKGPNFLSMPEDAWPKTEIDATPEATLEVRKKARATFEGARNRISTIRTYPENDLAFRSQQIFKLDQIIES